MFDWLRGASCWRRPRCCGTGGACAGGARSRCSLVVVVVVVMAVWCWACERVGLASCWAWRPALCCGCVPFCCGTGGARLSPIVVVRIHKPFFVLSRLANNPPDSGVQVSWEQGLRHDGMTTFFRSGAGGEVLVSVVASVEEGGWVGGVVCVFGSCGGTCCWRGRELGRAALINSLVCGYRHALAAGLRSQGLCRWVAIGSARWSGLVHIQGIVTTSASLQCR